MNSLRSVICPLEVKVYAFIAALLRPKFVRGNHLKVNVCTAIVKRLDLVVAPTAAIHVNVQDAPTNGDVSDRASGSPAKQIGRASCRERVCQYVSISVVAVSLKKKKKRAQRHYKITQSQSTSEIKPGKKQ